MRALYATCNIVKHGKATGLTRTFRIGLPASDAVITARHERFDRSLWNNGQHLAVVHGGVSYPVRSNMLEIRDVNRAGQGLGGPRHFDATAVKVGALMIERDREHSIETYVNRGWRATGAWGATVKAKGRGVFIGHGSTPLLATAEARKRARFAGAI